MWGLVAVEAGLAVALVAGAPDAAAIATGVFLAFALAVTAALLAGQRGRPCACFGSASRLSWSSPLRPLLPATLAAVAAFGGLPAAPSSYDRWLTVGFAVSAAVLVALALGVLALAREVGVLRLQNSSKGALEIEGEGPALGVAQAWATGVLNTPRALLKLAIFTSEACPLCRAVEPAVAHVASDPLVSVAIFDEVSDAQTWSAGAIPGSPYAVALDLNGVTLAKGTFNGLAQLESVVATARSRERTESRGVRLAV